MKIRRAAREDRTDADGVVFDSKAEMTRYYELKLLERADLIRNLTRQPYFDFVINGRPTVIRSERYPQGRKCGYTADFQYEEKSSDDGPWHIVIEDCKGIYTDVTRLRIAVAEAIYGFRVRISGKADRVRRR